MAKIFIIEDDVTLRSELTTLLERYDYEVASSDDFKDIVDITLAADPSLVLLDINLPYFDGYHVCREIRKHSSVPIIVITSRNSDLDEVMSMNLGADDFVAKPYNTSVLLARISSLLRRSSGESDNQRISHGGLELDAARSTVRRIGSHTNGQADGKDRGDREVELTKNELRILYTLMVNAGTIVSRDELMNELWQSEEFVDDNTLTVNINRLRKKLEQVGVEDYLVTKRGQGYLV